MKMSLFIAFSTKIEHFYNNLSNSKFQNSKIHFNSSKNEKFISKAQKSKSSFQKCQNENENFFWFIMDLFNLRVFQAVLILS